MCPLLPDKNMWGTLWTYGMYGGFQRDSYQISRSGHFLKKSKTWPNDYFSRLFINSQVGRLPV